MNFKTTILLIVLLAVASAAYFFTRDTPGREEVESQRSKAGDPAGSPLFSADDLPTESVSTLTIQRGEATIVLTRDGENWRQSEPIVFPISTWQGKTIVDKAATLRYSDRFQPGEGENPSLAEVGLDKPVAVVTVDVPARDDKPAKQHVIKFGRVIGGSAYVMVDDKPDVYAVGADAQRMFATTKVSDWRSRSLTAPTEGSANAITLQQGDTSIELTKIDSRWMLDAARGDRADGDAVRGLLTGVGGLYINEFVADAPSDLGLYGLDKPRLVLTTVTADKTHALRIGGPVDLAQESFFATYAQDDAAKPVVFTVGKAGVEKLQKTTDDLRDRRITVARTTEINEVTIDRDGSPAIHIVKKPEGWSFAQPPSVPAYAIDSAAVTELLDAIVDAKATSFATDVPTDVAPAATLTFNIVGGKAPEHLNVWPHKAADDQSAWLVLRDGEKTGYVVARDRLDGAFKPMVSLRSRDVITWSADQVAGITIERADGEYTLNRKREAEVGPWSLAGYDKIETDAVDALLHAIAPLRAEMWLGPEEVASTLTLTITPFEGEPITLKIDEQSRVAALSGGGPWTEGVIVVPQGLVDAAKAELRYRTVLPTNLNDFRKVTLTRGEQTMTIERLTDGKYVRSGDEALNEADAAALFDELAGLRVERFTPTEKAGVKLDAPTTLIAIEMVDGTSHKLALWPPSEGESRQHIGRVDEQPLAFVLAANSVEKLVKVLEPAANP